MLKFIQTSEQAFKPVRRTAGSAGFDLPIPHALRICPGEKVCIDLLNRVILPPGFSGLLVLRSSAARKHRLLLRAGLIGRLSRETRPNL
jgi:dUTPase